ncbi:MAG: TIGR03619 family F420-dependent LLM class oxidoreductase [Pseudomonadales bacterium]
MKIGVTLRNMGPQSSREMLADGALAAERLGFDSIWITDHVAIPPDDAEGSGGRYTDPLSTLAWLGGLTRRIALATGVLILPYRAPLPTARQIATVQDLTGNRLLLGVGVGWMAAEFRALGVDRRQRGRLTDEMLEFLSECFAHEVVTRNGQPFIFAPRPPAPPVYVGGAAPQALGRALRFGHGWLPMARDPDSLAGDLTTFRELARGVGQTPGPVTVMTGLPLNDTARALDRARAYAALGIERLVCALRYDTPAQYLDGVERLAELRARLAAAGDDNT